MSDTMAAETPMSDHVARFWQLLETEHVRILVDLRREIGTDAPDGPVVYWDSSSFGDDVAKALVAQRAWQPIETAPKDGTYVWVSQGFSMRIAFWADGKQFEHHGSVGGGWRDLAMAEHGDAADLMWAPTYWQALPRSPRYSLPNSETKVHRHHRTTT